MWVRRVLVAYHCGQSSETEEPVQDNGHLEAEVDPIGWALGPTNTFLRQNTGLRSWGSSSFLLVKLSSLMKWAAGSCPS